MHLVIHPNPQSFVNTHTWMFRYIKPSSSVETPVYDDKAAVIVQLDTCTRSICACIFQSNISSWDQAAETLSSNGLYHRETVRAQRLNT